MRAEEKRDALGTEKLFLMHFLCLKIDAGGKEHENISKWDATMIRLQNK